MLRAREDFEGDDEICVLMTARDGYQDLFEETFHTLGDSLPVGRKKVPYPKSSTPPACFSSCSACLWTATRAPELMRFLDEGGFTGSQRMFGELARQYRIRGTCVADPTSLRRRWEFFSTKPASMLRGRRRLALCAR